MDEKKHYPIMDKPYTEILGELIEDETCALIKTAVNVFYKAKGELIGYTIGNYMDRRFVERQHRFAKEEELLSPQQVKHFYENIDDSKLDLLFELLDKARTSTYNLHAKILAKLYGNFLKNKKLNYYESSLLANINTLNEDDILTYYYIYEENKKNNENIKIVKIETDEQFHKILSIQKFINIGILKKNPDPTFEEFGMGKVVKYIETDYSNEFHGILNEIVNE